MSHVATLPRPWTHSVINTMAIALRIGNQPCHCGHQIVPPNAKSLDLATLVLRELKRENLRPLVVGALDEGGYSFLWAKMTWFRMNSLSVERGNDGRLCVRTVNQIGVTEVWPGETRGGIETALWMIKRFMGAS
jgi:hypothetical protein